MSLTLGIAGEEYKDGDPNTWNVVVNQMKTRIQQIFKENNSKKRAWTADADEKEVAERLAAIENKTNKKLARLKPKPPTTENGGFASPRSMLKMGGQYKRDHMFFTWAPQDFPTVIKLQRKYVKHKLESVNGAYELTGRV